MTPASLCCVAWHCTFGSHWPHFIRGQETPFKWFIIVSTSCIWQQMNIADLVSTFQFAEILLSFMYFANMHHAFRREIEMVNSSIGKDCSLRVADNFILCHFLLRSSPWSLLVLFVASKHPWRHMLLIFCLSPTLGLWLWSPCAQQEWGNYFP